MSVGGGVDAVVSDDLLPGLAEEPSQSAIRHTTQMA
jgi:hypothetical protein